MVNLLIGVSRCWNPGRSCCWQPIVVFRFRGPFEIAANALVVLKFFCAEIIAWLATI